MKPSAWSIRLGILFVLMISAALVVLSTPVDAASTPGTVLLQGRMTDSNGDPVSLSNVSVVVKYYDAVTSGTLLATETLSNQDVTDGLYNISMGSGSFSGTHASLAAIVEAEADVWFTVNVDSDGETSPRAKLQAVPYALNAELIDGKEGAELLDTSASVQTKSSGLILNYVVLAEQSSNPHSTTAGQLAQYVTDDANQRLVVVDDADNTSVLHGPASDGPQIGTGSLALSSNLPQYARVIVEPETGTADDLDSITGGRDGQIIVLEVVSGDTVTAKDATGNLKLGSSTDKAVSVEDRLVLQYDGSNWHQLSFSDN